ncbi:glycosyltransferase [Caulobacter sp. S45]|uniref:glycosyltransferase n=1 Tax=Caulobacter sp. S45 TaxID=1641861 RepID=UPI0015751E89|nr:glycosyltransferase [Caulobacter sp. S45]
MDRAVPQFKGFFDAYRGGAFEGWVWRPDAPEQPVTVEVYANDVCLGEIEASIFRPDLRAAGIGHGRFGFSLPFPIDLERSEPIRITVRVKNGPLLSGGETTIGRSEPVSEDDAAAFKAFVAAVLGQNNRRKSVAERSEPKTNFIVYCPTGLEARSDFLSVAEYDYGFVLNAFTALLERFGQVHRVDDPARQVDVLHGAHLLRGEVSLFLSFAPPHRTTLGLRCPVIPVIAWQYPTIPSEVWDGERRHDWRWVLGQAGRAITLSNLAARAIKAGLGADFPVISLPTPIWDRQPQLHHLPVRSPTTPAKIKVDGFVCESRTVEFSAGMAAPRLPAPGELPDWVDLDGVVFTSVLSPADGRKNWPDLVTAFLAAFSDRPDATLVLKMVGDGPELWWSDLFDRVGRMPAFACRLVIISAAMDDADHGSLIAASHWVVNASTAEGLCLPLMEFMCSDRPAIAPVHTAMADYLDAACALVVHSDEQYCGWPHDFRMGMPATSHQVSWSSLRDAYVEAYRLVMEEPARYQALGQAAGARMEAFCSDAMVAERLSSFLGLGHLTTPPPQASALVIADAFA